jgi:hypothetical protein
MNEFCKHIQCECVALIQRNAANEERDKARAEARLLEKKLIYIEAAARGIQFDERFDSPQAESVRKLRAENYGLMTQRNDLTDRLRDAQAEIQRLQTLCAGALVDMTSAEFIDWIGRLRVEGRKANLGEG